jgi:hypothetical protein
MRTETIIKNIYQFSELSDEAKQKAIDKWYEFEDYPFLEEELTQLVTEKLEEAGVKHNSINLLYSLSYCQGDGLCFTGTIEKDGKRLELTHNYRYYFASSVTMSFTDDEGEEVDDDETLKAVYFNVCKEVEKIGYDIIEYRMTFEEMDEHCEANLYEFDESGIMI